MGRFNNTDGVDEHFAHTCQNHSQSVSLLMDGEMVGRFLGCLLEVARPCGSDLPEIFPRGKWVQISARCWELQSPSALPLVLFGGDNNTKCGIIKVVLQCAGD